MKVRGSDRYVSQAGNFEQIEVIRITGHVVVPPIRLGNIATVGEVVIENTELLQHIAADVHALMAGYATVFWKR